MADNKQYVTQPQENGNVLISEDVIATIVSHAATDVEGVIGMSGKPGAEIIEMISKKNWGKGIKITIGENNELYIDCNVIVNYGLSVVNVAKAVQEAVISALVAVANLKVEEVNVNICGIVRQ